MKISVEQTPKQKISDYVLGNVNSVSIVHLPGSPLGNSTRTVSSLRKRTTKINVIPHIAARNLKNKKELFDACDKFLDYGIRDLLLIGGSKARGSCYGNAHDVQNDLLEKDYNFNYFCGIDPNQETHQQVKEKKYNRFDRGISQICFNHKLLNAFDSRTVVGVPSNCSAKDLFKFVKLCGVTKTAKEAATNIAGLRYISYYGFNTVKFVQKLNKNQDIHIFNFGNLDNTIKALKKYTDKMYTGK